MNLHRTLLHKAIIDDKLGLSDLIESLVELDISIDDIKALLGTRLNSGETAFHFLAGCSPDALPKSLSTLRELGVSTDDIKALLGATDSCGRTFCHFFALFNPEALPAIFGALEEAGLSDEDRRTLLLTTNNNGETVLALAGLRDIE